MCCGQLIKQAIADETKAGMAAKAYVEKGVMGENISLILWTLYVCVHSAVFRFFMADMMTCIQY